MSTRSGFGVDHGVWPTSPRPFGCRDLLVLEQDSLELRLLGRVHLVAWLDGRLAFGNRNRELGKVLDSFSLVERAALGVRIDGRAGDGEDRTDVEAEELLGVRCLERDHVHDEVEAVGNVKSALLVTVECDGLEAVDRPARGAACNREVPAVRRERAGDGSTDVAGTPEDEGAGRDLSRRV